MFGKNKLEKVAKDNGDVLEVNSIFYTIQGEGPYTGRPAVFIRLAGCNLHCWFCDTEFEKRAPMTVEQIVAQVLGEARRGNDEDALVVITGGEPLRQQIIPLLVGLTRHDLDVQIETAGTVVPPDVMMYKNSVNPVTFERMLEQPNIMLVCSPKTGSVAPMIEKHCQHYKYIVRDGELDPIDGLPNYGTQQRLGDPLHLYRPPFTGQTVWLQPMMEYHDYDGPPNDNNCDIEATHANAQAAVASAMAYGYRLSFQIHKALGLP